ncbi:MAG: VWA domain-containing protein [Chloroflexota bacterium]|nr:VWA domain-containing protein [Chloroflexota bacterium]
MKPQTRFLAAVFAVFVFFVVFAFQAPPAHADGLVYVDCPPIVVPLGGTPMPIPMPQPLPPVGIAPGAPPIITAVPPRPPVPPIRRDCATYLAVKNHNVTVTIDNQIARTHVDETFFNDSAYALEGTYIFPLPDDATISDFAMWVDGKRLEGQVLDKNQARQIYEDIVRHQRDPALLEYIGRNAFQARIFPIPPQSTKRVEIEYSQILKADNGLVRYVYPLNTEKFSPKPLGSVSVNVSIKSSAALKAIYSPSHNVSVSRDGNFAAKVGYEDANVKPDRDFVLYYSVTQDDIGLNLVSYKPALSEANGTGSGDGFFVMLVAPKVDVDKSQVIAKDVILVLDVSGSMQGAKIAQAKNALYYVLDHLNSNDRFNIISFSTGTRAYASSLQPASKRDDARNFVSRLVAEGSTDINRALLEAIGNVDPSRPATIIFLTDGLPTTGEINSQKIIANATSAAPKNARLFTFGVGDDVNTILLDTLAEKLRGASGYVRPTDKIDEIVSAFYAKVSTPVLSDVSIDWGGITVSDVYPYPLPDLFAGTQLVVAGRYRNGGPTTIVLKGMVNGNSQSFRYSDVTFRDGGGGGSTALTTSFIPRLWATRKIGYLLNQIRLTGESKEVVNEIVTLAVRYGIVTPYTSFLVDERADVLTQSGRSDVAKEAQKSFAPSAMPTSGAAAVQQSQQQQQLQNAGVAPSAAPVPVSPGSVEQVTPLQVIGDKTFLLRGGVWTDTQFDPSKMTTKKIEFGSDAYFALGANNPDWGKYLALGARVIVVLNGAAYEITDNGRGATDASAAPTSALSPSLERGGDGGEVTPTPYLMNEITPEPNGALDWALVIGGGLLGLGVIGSAIAVVVRATKKS